MLPWALSLGPHFFNCAMRTTRDCGGNATQQQTVNAPRSFCADKNAICTPRVGLFENFVRGITASNQNFRMQSRPADSLRRRFEDLPHFVPVAFIGDFD